jgi:STAM-binding protein
VSQKVVVPRNRGMLSYLPFILFKALGVGQVTTLQRMSMVENFLHFLGMPGVNEILRKLRMNERLLGECFCRSPVFEPGSSMDSIQGPPPMTTTSPRPNDFPKSVPAQMLMSSHQLAQGYTPSLSSMVSNFQSHPPIEQSTLLANRAFQFSEKNLMPQNPYPRRPGKPSQMPVQLMDPRSQAEAARVRHFDARKDRQMQNLKPVDVPKDILKRFMALAAENTELKKETLGLLLGKIRHEKYIVTTLLIPNQSGGEDWCAMENDDMIVQFQERRFLVTLGWVSSTPSVQLRFLIFASDSYSSNPDLYVTFASFSYPLTTITGFMSSCDLHTHAPYQQMLPEAFAIVCSPRFKPK